MNATVMTQEPSEHAFAARFGTDEERWRALCRRDAAADGQFFFAVATTGVYCHPSCAARRPRRENVTFHLSRQSAEQAGFRPCRRCRPDLPPRAEREAAMVAAACRMIEAAERIPDLAALAARAGMNAQHFHRTFRRVAGVTPRAYAAGQRQHRVQDELRMGSSITEAIYDAGFNSSGRFYEAAPETLGMTPSAYRDGGRGETIRYGIAPCSLGQVLVAVTTRGLCAILLGDDPAALCDELAGRFRKARILAAEPSFGDLLKQVVRLIDDPADSPAFALPLDIRGTAFQRRVWEALRAIPPGTTASYAQLAARLGQPRAVRAVAGACAANPLAVAVPCHRVVGSDGRLTGYRWGIERKRRLIAREREQ